MKVKQSTHVHAEFIVYSNQLTSAVPSKSSVQADIVSASKPLNYVVSKNT